MTTGPGRPRKPAGAYYTISLKEIKGDAQGRWRARTEAWDINGKLCNVTAVSPYANDSKGRYIRDRNGNRARAEVIRKCEELAKPRHESTLTPYSYLDQVWQQHRERLINVEGKEAGTIDKYDTITGQMLKLFPRLQLIQIDARQGEKTLETLGKAHGLNAVHIGHAVLSGIFSYAEWAGVHVDNPMPGVSKFYASVEAKGRTGGAGIPTLEMAAQIFEAIHSGTAPCPAIKGGPKGVKAVPSIAEFCESRDLVDLFDQAMECANRPSQLMGLRMCDFDLDNLDAQGRGKVRNGYGKVILEARNLVWKPARRANPNPKRQVDPKNASQEFSLSPRMVAIYRRRIVKLKQEGLAAGRPVVVGGFDADGVPLDLMFPNPPDGLLRSPKYVSEQWKRVARALGLPDDITFYSFRHLVLDQVADGMGAEAASGAGGHTSEKHLKNYRNQAKTDPEVATLMDKRIRGIAG